MSREEHFSWMGVCTACIGLLFTGNVYFFKKMSDDVSDRLKSLESITWQVRQDVAVMQASQNTRKGK